MDIVYVICIAIIAMTVGFVAGVKFAVGPSSTGDLTRDETRRLNRLVDRATSMTTSRTVTLWGEGEMLDQVIIRGSRWE